MSEKNLVRNILNELKWRRKKSLQEAEIWYIHRGAPRDTKIINGEKIQDIKRSFIKTEHGMIPFHRIFKIVYKNKTLFKRDRDT